MDAQWSRHWDTICLGTVTIATAVLGAVILLSGGLGIALPLFSGTPSTPEALKALSTVAAATLYVTLITIAGVSIYLFSGESAAHITVKRWIGFAVYLLFALQVLALTALLMVSSATGVTDTSDQPAPSASQSAGPVADVFGAGLARTNLS